MCQAPAKINLGLHVLRRRSDGYHEIETVLLPIGWQDTLTVQPADTFQFSCSDPSLPTDGRNLCVQAAHALARWAAIEPHGVLRLEKRIPHGAGLGGGSSDAAHTLQALAAHWELVPPHSVLHDIAARLGSDVPFFLYDEAMLATGRGEKLQPLDRENPYRFPYPLVVAMPPVSVSTAEAYRLVEPSSADRTALRSVVRSNDLERWRRDLVNDFEGPIMRRYPEIRHVRQVLADAGAGYVAMSGSGAAVFGVFESGAQARDACAAARAAGCTVWTDAKGG